MVNTFGFRDSVMNILQFRFTSFIVDEIRQEYGLTNRLTAQVLLEKKQKKDPDGR
jgi:hypothetical protein